MPRTQDLRLLAVMAVFACTPEKDAPDTDGPATGTSTSAPTEAGDSTTGAEDTAATDETTAAGDTSTGEATTTTDDPTGAAVGPCADYCALLAACDDRRAEGCMDGCADQALQYAYPGEACTALHEDYLACMTGQTCEALAAGSPCEEESYAIESDACTIGICDDYADRLVECDLADPDWKFARAFECTMAMFEARFEVGDACGDANEASVVCVAGAACEELESAEACQAEADAVNMICL